MKINRSSRFKRSFKKLSPKIKKDFDRKIKIFFNNPFSPSLRTHKLRGNLADYYAFYLKDGYRVLFDFVGENTVILVNIGSHDDYKNGGERNKKSATSDILKRYVKSARANFGL